MQRKETDWEAAGRALLHLQHQEAISTELSKPYALFIKESRRLSKVVSIWHYYSPANNIVINLLTQSGNTYCQQVATERTDSLLGSSYEFPITVPDLLLIELSADLDDFAGLAGLGKTRKVNKLSIASSYITENGISPSLSNKGCIYYAVAEFEKLGSWSVSFNRYGQNGAVVKLLAFDGIVPKTRSV